MQRGKFYIGIDWATEKHALCVMDAEGKVIKERSIPNDTTLFEIILALVEGAPADQVFVSIETRRLVLVDALVARRFKVFTINPKQSERFRERFSVAGAKDDRFDARVLASSLRTDTDLFRAVEPESEARIRLRSTTRTRQTIQEQFREVANRLRDVVMSSMPLLLGLCNGADEAWFWELVLLVPTAAKARRISDKRLSAILQHYRIRRFDVDGVRRVLDRSHLSAAAGVCEDAHWQARLLIEQLKLLERQQKSVDADIKEALDSLPKLEGAPSDGEIIMSCPGFAEQTTAVLFAEAGAAVERRDYDELRSVSGVAPVTQSSGKRRSKSKWAKAKPDGLIVMRRAANMRLRNAMHHAGSAASRDPHFAPIYARLRATGASHGRAVRGVVDRLLRVLVAMLRDRTLYKAPAPPAAAAA